VIRLAPPLVIDEATLDEAASRIIDTLRTHLATPVDTEVAAKATTDPGASVAHMQ
jgi:ornithine--oxo-acid transaminase